MNHQPPFLFNSTTFSLLRYIGQEPPEPYELAAEAGDAMFMHHLILHEGNYSHSANRKRRIALGCNAWCNQELIAIDPATPKLSTRKKWQKSYILKCH